jgi:serine/threonine protein kinase
VDSPEKAPLMAASLRVGNMVGRYKLLAPLAAGGMAHVWAAKPEGKLGFSRTVALKVVRPEYSADAEYARMLVDEATVAGAIHHPNVCELYEFDEADGLLFMVMEWVAGDALSGLLHQGDKLRPIRYQYAARIVADACSGVHAAHEAVDPDGNPLNIVHRDISPPNILMSQEGQVKVSDFGIAKARYQLHERTRTGDIKGKFAYIPPEQIVGRGVSRRSDVYALGCVLYVATLGLRPFGRGPSAMPKILRGHYRKPRELLATYPAELEAIIVRALSCDPAGRFETAEEMRLALEQWITTSGNVVTPSDIARVVRRRLNPERRQTIEALRHTNKPLLVAMAERTERELPDDGHTLTPTASSGLVIRPDELSHSSSCGRSGKPGEDPSDDSTLIDQSGPNEDPSAVRHGAAPAGDAEAEPPVSIPAVSAPVPAADESDVAQDPVLNQRLLSLPTQAAPTSGRGDAALATPTVRPGAASVHSLAGATSSRPTEPTAEMSPRDGVVRVLLAALVVIALTAMFLLTR